jgi:hypothetical protein
MENKSFSPVALEQHTILLQSSWVEELQSLHGHDPSVDYVSRDRRIAKRGVDFTRTRPFSQTSERRPHP